MTENLHGKSERPSPLVAVELLRSVIECWRELDGELTRKGGPSSSAGSSEFGVPLDLTVLDAIRAIDLFARTYCHMLMDETDWTPPAMNTGALIQGLIDRVGHFTHSDEPQIAYEFTDELEDLHRTSWAVARPDGKARIPIGPCYVDGCDGKLRVLIDRDRPLDRESLTVWRPNAKCDEDGEHVIDARLYAQTQGPEVIDTLSMG